jgi:hypothetical protein
MKKSFICVVMAAFMAASYFVACGDDDSSEKSVSVLETEPADDLDSSSSEISSSSEKSGDAKEKSSSSAKSSSSETDEAEVDSLMSKYVDECDESKTPDVCTNKDGIGIIKACIKGRLIEYSCRTAACNEKGDDCDLNMSKIECKDDTPDVCTNNGKGIGIIKTCVRGQLIEYSCQSASCNEEGNDCGECVNNVSTCTDDKDFKGTVTKCENGKKVEKECGNASCDGNKCGTCLNYNRTCENDENGVGIISQCVNGKPSSVMTEPCEHGFSCKRTQVGEKKDENGFTKSQWKFTKCGECLEGELKCENDPSDYGVMYRCFEGQWIEITNGNGFSKCKYDDEGYLIGEMTGDHKIDCQEYVTFPDTGRYNHLSISIGLYARTTVSGYIWGEIRENVPIGLHAYDSEHRVRVSCDADGKMLGICHNSVRNCINTERGKNGYLIVCQGGRLMDFDGDGDNIACYCQESGHNNGGCSSSTNCYAAQTAVTGKRMCAPPNDGDKTGFEIEDDPDYGYEN